MSEKPTYRWHQLLAPLRPPPTLSILEQERRFAIGKQIHQQLQHVLSEMAVEQTGIYEEPELPCKIAYYADLVNEELSFDGTLIRTLYEIKPLFWFMKYSVYCTVQASGYYHFVQANRGAFALYMLDDQHRLQSVSLLPFTPIPWPELRALAIRGFAETHNLDLDDTAVGFDEEASPPPPPGL